MTTNDYQRPSETAKRAGPKVSFWAQVWEKDCCPDERCEHVLSSPVFATKPDLDAWERPHRRAGHRVLSMRREVDSPTAYRDVPLYAEEPMSETEKEANKARLMGMLRDALNPSTRNP